MPSFVRTNNKKKRVNQLMALKCEVVLNEWWTDIASTVLCKKRPQYNTNIQYSESAAKKQSSNTVDSIAPCLSKHVIRVYISGAWSAKRFKHLNGVVRSLCKSQVLSFQPEDLCWLSTRFLLIFIKDLLCKQSVLLSMHSKHT